jgi:hypothetical protein
VIRALLFLKFGQHIRQIEVFHIDVCVLEVLIEISNAVEDVNVVDGSFEEVVDEVLEQQSFDVLVTVGRNLILLVVKLSIGRSEVSVFFFYFFPLALFLTFVHYNSTIINPTALTTTASEIVQKNLYVFVKP